MDSSNKSDSQFYVFRGYLSSSEKNTVTLGLTSFYVNSTEVEPWDSNWYWTEITIANANKDYNSSKVTTSHEFGHAMGLRHQNQTRDSIMCQAMYGRFSSVTRASELDLYHINHIYN